MGFYDRISKKVGLSNWQYNIFHDDGNRESDGGGKSCAYLSPPGKGKSTLMAQAAQNVHSVEEDSKKSFLAHFNAGKSVAGYKVEPETVIWRLREFDNVNALFPENWIRSYPGWQWTVKPVHIFVHWKDEPVFYSFERNKPVSPVHMPPIEKYYDAGDLMDKLHWNCINAVLEPQTYRLSENLIASLQKHKMEDDDSAVEEPPRPAPTGAPATQGRLHPIDPKTGEPIKWKHVRKTPKETAEDRKDKEREKKKKKKKVDYAKKFVDPAYFWYDLLDIAYRSNNRKHITFFIDEFHDVAEADCEGDAWKLVSILATKTYPQFRKNNVSLHLSTHQLIFVDYRIVKRIEYINWFRGAKISPNNSMIGVQALLSNLDIGQIINEEVNIQFGIMHFDKIHNAPPQLYIEGLMGQNKSLVDSDIERLRQVQDALTAPDYFKMKPKNVCPDTIEI